MTYCMRCGGLMVREYMPSETSYIKPHPCLRCVNCGYRDDLIFGLNRRIQKGVTCEEVFSKL